MRPYWTMMTSYTGKISISTSRLLLCEWMVVTGENLLEESVWYLIFFLFQISDQNDYRHFENIDSDNQFYSLVDWTGCLHHYLLGLLGLWLWCNVWLHVRCSWSPCHEAWWCQRSWRTGMVPGDDQRHCGGCHTPCHQQDL